MTDSAADRKRDHSAVDQSSSATDEEDRGPMIIEDKRQRLQDEIAMVTAECQDDSHIEWDEDEERVWKHRLKHIEDLKANQTYERVQRQNVSQKVLSHRWVDKPHRSRYTVRGYEQELTGSEDLYAPTPLSCLVKTLLVCAEREGHTVAQMRFCKVSCWKKFTLNLQQKHRNPQMWCGDSTKLFLVSKEALLHGERALMEFWVALL